MNIKKIAFLLLLTIEISAQTQETGPTEEQLIQAVQTAQQFVHSTPVSDVPVDSLVQSVLDFSAGYLGTPYHYGSSGPQSFDCSGFTSFVFKHFGYKLSHGCTRQITEGQRVDKDGMQPGDLIFFTSRRSGKGGAGHVGIVVENYGNGNVRFIHASTQRGVRYDELTSGYYASRYITGLRVLPENTPVTAE
jgi:cell wall-associated NlpC family hydrolase